MNTICELQTLKPNIYIDSLSCNENIFHTILISSSFSCNSWQNHLRKALFVSVASWNTMEYFTHKEDINDVANL